MSEDDDAPSLLRVPAGVTDDPQFMKKYELERELGVGGSGVVFCARHRELDERVAIKFLLAPPDNAEAMARFRREARAANRVKNEHVVRIVDVSTIHNGVPYVVMEYLEGTDLERLLLESPDAQLPVRDAVEFVLQTCEALAECHAIGIVHRDLKPSNLFCTYGADGLPIIKVLDFGISKLGTVTIDEAMTGKNAIMGSPRYMSPEQFATPTDVDHRADIWALGIILYELVTGIVPFTANTLIGIWERVKNVVPPAVAEMRRDAPRGLEPVILRCLEKDRGNRYQNVAELAKALLPFAPERCRASVARIVRIVESPGVNTASLSLPPSGRASTSATAMSVSSGNIVARGSRSTVFVVIGAAAAIGLVLLLGRRPTPTSSHLPVTSAPVEGTVMPSSAKPPPAPVVVSEPSVLPVPVPHADAPVPSASTANPSPARGHVPTSGSLGRPSASFARLPSTAGPSSSTASSATSGPASVASAPPPPTGAAVAAPTGSDQASRSPGWIVDIVEKRKAKGGASP